ncbi:MAG: M81 family metallopeptidase [Caldilineaceae bacterium]|nr:M81 family metallopeptidase [Caldilineaceae bacterium]
MPKILIGECKQEISSFNPVLSRYHDFEISWGQEILDYHTELNTEVCGALGIFQAQPDVTLAPAYSARMIVSGGTLAQADFERIKEEFLAAVRAAPPVDGVYLSLHGAMAAEKEDDPEGLLLAEIRQIVGEQIPIVVSLDLHGILTERMLRHADAIVSYHTYPHVDFATTGERAARLLLRILAGEVRPVTALVKIPALVRGDELITATGLFGQMIRHAQQIEASPGGLSAGMFIGNPFTDVRELRSNSFVVTDGDAERAAAEATQMANDFWAVRAKLQAPLTTMDETVEICRNTQGTVILKDAADATSSGASGDSAIIVGALLKAGYEGSILAPVVDEAAVNAAVAAGVGNMVQTTVGGSLDSRRFEAIPITARVHMISEGRFLSESNNATWNSGTTAVLVAENVTWVVTSRAVSLYDRSLFYAHGQDPKDFDVVIVKSPHCQHHMFDDWAAAVVNVDVAGSTSANLPTLGHTRCARPIFPLDKDVTFAPEVKIFRRG